MMGMQKGRESAEGMWGIQGVFVGSTGERMSEWGSSQGLSPISLHTVPGAGMCLLTFLWGWTWE